jgi:hypothetical protein
LLIDARSDGALVFGGPSGLATAYNAHGERLWRSDRLADRFEIICGPGCRNAVASATGESVSRPEISDPPPLRVDADGAHDLAGKDPRSRVVWWQDQSTYVRVYSTSLGGTIHVESVVDGRAFALLPGVPAGASVQLRVDGDSGALLVSGSRSEVLLVHHAKDGRWRASGTPMRVPHLETGCVAEVAGRPVSVAVGDDGVFLVRGSSAVRVPGVGAGVMDCAVTSSGFVVALGGGETTRVDYLDMSGSVLWTREVHGTAQLSADGASPLVAVMSLEGRRVVVLNRRQTVVRSSPADDARLVGGRLVTVQGDRAPRWSALS